MGMAWTERWHANLENVFENTFCGELCMLCTDVYSFLSYGYEIHATLGVMASDDTQGLFCQPQEHRCPAVHCVQWTWVSEPDAFDEPATQQVFVQQLIHYLQARRTAMWGRVRMTVPLCTTNVCIGSCTQQKVQCKSALKSLPLFSDRLMMRCKDCKCAFHCTPVWSMYL